MKTYFAFMLALFCSTSFAATKEITGKFIKVDWGDYRHLIIEVDRKNVDFWCVGRSKPLDCDDLEKSPESYIGKMLKVKFETKMVYVPQAEGEISQDQVTGISLAR